MVSLRDVWGSLSSGGCGVMWRHSTLKIPNYIDTDCFMLVVYPPQSGKWRLACGQAGTIYISAIELDADTARTCARDAWRHCVLRRRGHDASSSAPRSTVERAVRAAVHRDACVPRCALGGPDRSCRLRGRLHVGVRSERDPGWLGLGLAWEAWDAWEASPSPSPSP